VAECDDRLAALPFPVVNGWPQQLDGTLIRACEAGIALGEFSLPGLLAALRDAAEVRSIRIDEDPEPEEWKTVLPDGTESISHVVVPPNKPFLVPMDVVADDRALANWIAKIHGSWGRVLLWHDQRWWIVNDPDLELSLLCGPPEWVEQVSGGHAFEPFSWLPYPSAGDLVRDLYGL
jgi:hypothetical protein